MICLALGESLGFKLCEAWQKEGATLLLIFPWQHKNAEWKWLRSRVTKQLVCTQGRSFWNYYILIDLAGCCSSFHVLGRTDALFNFLPCSPVFAYPVSSYRLTFVSNKFILFLWMDEWIQALYIQSLSRFDGWSRTQCHHHVSLHLKRKKVRLFSSNILRSFA